jgi:hypothetical protein
MDPAVAEFFRQLDHPLKPECEAVAGLIRTAGPAIEEGIKWKAPSFRAGEYFATLNLRDPKSVQVILHLGAKARPDVTARLPIQDPANLLQWLGNDRAVVKFRHQTEIDNLGPA